MSDDVSRVGNEMFEFGPFRVDPGKQTLLRGCEPIAITPKTFQLLLVLVRHGNEIVAKDELMKSVWPETFVEETNLTRNIFALRKALGESEQNRYIITVSGRGYRLAENVRLIPAPEISIAAASRATVQVSVVETKSWAWIVAGVLAVLVVAVGTWRFLQRGTAVLT